jgi:hypothetical protein
MFINIFYQKKTLTKKIQLSIQAEVEIIFCNIIFNQKNELLLSFHDFIHFSYMCPHFLLAHFSTSELNKELPYRLDGAIHTTHIFAQIFCAWTIFTAKTYFVIDFFAS